MVKPLVGALALASLPSALAFRNTSPFFLFSTADLNVDGKELGFAQSTKITNEVRKAVSACPSKTYFVVRQDGVSSADYTYSEGASRMAAHMTGRDSSVQSTMAVSEAVGVVDADSMADYIIKQCGEGSNTIRIHAEAGKNNLDRMPKADTQPLVVEIHMPAPTQQNRLHLMDNNDALLQAALAQYAESTDYTVIYTTTPNEAQAEPPYEMENPFGDAVQMELKRDTSSAQQRRAQANAQKTGALFERYQYLSPGLFMGFIAFVPLVSIIIIALKAITSLEVSYFAFSKEMGPAGQKKL